MTAASSREAADGEPTLPWALDRIATLSEQLRHAHAATPGDRDRDRELADQLAAAQALIPGGPSPLRAALAKVELALRGSSLDAAAETEAGDRERAELYARGWRDAVRPAEVTRNDVARAARSLNALRSDETVPPGLQGKLGELADDLTAAWDRATPPSPESEAVTTAEVIAWHRARFGGDPADVLVMGKLAEEAGEVCGAITKRAEGAVRPAKGLVTREDWSAHLLDEVGDVGIVLHTLCAREGTTLDEVVTRRFRDDVSKRVGQEVPPQQATGDRAEPRTDWTVPTLAPDLHPASEKESDRG